MQGLSLFRSRFFRNLFASYAAVLVVTGVVVGLLLNHRLERSLRGELEGELRDHCVLLGTLGERAFRGELDGASVQRELVALGAQAQLRLTLIGVDGAVLGDSEKAPGDMENHGQRPEILEARQAGFGVDQRKSRTVGFEMIYVAHALERPSDREPVKDELLGFVRVSLPYTAVAAELARTRQTVILGTGVGLLVALAVGLFLARRFTAPIVTMTRVAEDLRAGQYDQRVPLAHLTAPTRASVATGALDEARILGETLNALAEEVTQRIARLSSDDAQLRAILASMVEGVVAVDEEQRVAFCNSAARELLDLNPDQQAVGASLWSIAPIRELEGLLSEAQEQGRAAQSEVELFRGERERVLNVHASPFEGGDRHGIVIVIHDVTELRRLERVRRDFVANVSHELKTPLTSIKGFVETLLSGALHDEENNERFLRRIEANVDRLTHLVADLLSLARVEGEQSDVPRTEVDWGALAAEVGRRHEDSIRRKGLEYTADLNVDAIVLADREALIQVHDNLLDNAIKYTPAPGQVRVSLGVEEDHAVIEVADTGLGIPAGDLDRVFERFYRVDKARSRELGGTGLGLSIVKNLVLRMNGDVTVESTEGQGTCFRVRLPLARRQPTN